MCNKTVQTLGPSRIQGQPSLRAKQTAVEKKREILFFVLIQGEKPTEGQDDGR